MKDDNDKLRYLQRMSTISPPAPNMLEISNLMSNLVAWDLELLRAQSERLYHQPTLHYLKQQKTRQDKTRQDKTITRRKARLGFAPRDEVGFADEGKKVTTYIKL
jgi:hypothetical protein